MKLKFKMFESEMMYVNYYWTLIFIHKNMDKNVSILNKKVVYLTFNNNIQFTLLYCNVLFNMAALTQSSSYKKSSPKSRNYKNKK